MAATAIIVAVPEAEPATDRWRRKYTPDGAEGMPPHVTLLFPFEDEARLVAGQIREIRAILGGFLPFGFTLVDFAEFSSPDASHSVLYLAPEPSDQFRDMTDALVQAFPNFPPYGGQFDTVIPHLTIADDQNVPLQDIRDDVAAALPIKARATEAHVMRYGDGGWTLKSRIYLGRKEPDYRDQPLFV